MANRALAAHTLGFFSATPATISKDYVFLSPSGTVGAPPSNLTRSRCKEDSKGIKLLYERFLGRNLPAHHSLKYPECTAGDVPTTGPGPLEKTGDRDPDACEVESRRGPPGFKEAEIREGQN